MEVNLNNLKIGIASFSPVKNLAFMGRKKPLGALDNDTFEKQQRRPDPKRIDDERKADISEIRPWAKNLISDAESSYTIFCTRMRNIFHNTCNYVAPGVNNILPEDKKIGDLKLNMKSPTSLIEKILSGNRKNEADAKNSIQDMIRGRIILKSGSKKEGNAICSELTKAVEKHKLEIKEITYYCSDPKMQYISDASMNKLRQAIDKNYGEDSYNYRYLKKDSGYNGVHIIMKIDDDFDAELQIMGKEVERLKDVEDVFYKLRHNKHVKQKYNNIKNIYKDLYEEDSDDLQKKLDAYAKEAYVAQRQKELGIYKGDKCVEFTPLDTDKIDLPKEFDFNYIANLKD